MVTGVSMSELELIISFGVATLLVFTGTYFFFDRGRSRHNQDSTSRRRPFSITFARLFGLITVAFIGASLTFTDVATEFATSAYTLLGTIAGYLAGASPTSTAATPGPNAAETEAVL
jgi:hypothetical protein